MTGETTSGRLLSYLLRQSPGGGTALLAGRRREPSGSSILLRRVASSDASLPRALDAAGVPPKRLGEAVKYYRQLLGHYLTTKSVAA
jgi:hypothetical protein